MTRLVQESPENRLAALDNLPIYEAPLVGFANGNDPLFAQYKEIIGPFHMTPQEALEGGLKNAPQAKDIDWDGLSVISWILPISRRTRLSNRHRDTTPSVRWAHTRWYGEMFSDHTRREVVRLLKGHGYAAVAPALSPSFKTISLDSGPASNWSERHVAYAAGLGTFSLSDGFITPKGIAMRCASVVTDLKLPPSPRPYKNHYANCLYYHDGSCGECIERCPAGAISGKGHDKIKCQDYQSQVIGYLKEYYGVGVHGCGLCQTSVPCEAQIPPKTLR